MSYVYNLEAAFRDDAVESGKYLSLPPGGHYPSWVVDVLNATSEQDLRETLSGVVEDDRAPTAPFYLQSFKVPSALLGAILTADDWGKLVHISMEEAAFLQNLRTFHEQQAKHRPPSIGVPRLNVRDFVSDGGVPSYVRMMVLKMAYARLADTVICHLANHGERHPLVPALLSVVEEGTKVKNDMFMVLRDPPVGFHHEREEWLKNSLATATTGDGPS